MRLFCRSWCCFLTELLERSPSLENILVSYPESFVGSVEWRLVKESFYSQQSIPEIEVKRLSDCSKRIPEPPLFGQFNDTTHYLETLDLLLALTLETSHRYEFFQKVVVPLLSGFSSMLDVGPGDGGLCHILSNDFEEIVALDANREPLRRVEDKLVGKDGKLIFVNKSIVDANLPRNHFNLVILSHILYYLDRSLWPRIIEKLFDSLSQGGVLVVVLNGGLGKRDMITHFGGMDFHLDHTIKDFLSKRTPAQVGFFSTKELYLTFGVSPMCHVAGLHLYDADIRVEKKRLIGYLEENSATGKGFYEMDIYQRFVVIKK